MIKYGDLRNGPATADDMYGLVTKLHGVWRSACHFLFVPGAEAAAAEVVWMRECVIASVRVGVESKWSYSPIPPKHKNGRIRFIRANTEGAINKYLPGAPAMLEEQPARRNNPDERTRTNPGNRAWSLGAVGTLL